MQSLINPTLTTLVEIPSIRDNQNGYNYLFKLAQRIMENPYQHFNFNFKKCSILDQNAVALLGGLAGYVHAHSTFSKSCGVMFLVETMSPLISKHLIENNFLSHFSKSDFEGYPNGDYIGYRQHTNHLDVNEVANHLNDQWLSDEKISISTDLKSAIVSRILEIFMNAYGHGVEKSKLQGLGITSCGQYIEKEGKLRLTVVDFGCGIIENVKQHLNSEISDVKAMQWALETGHSTRTDSSKDIPRGLGFGLLSEFVSVNAGELGIFSNSCCAKKIEKNNDYEVSIMKTPFSGTMVTITINCDGNHYFISDSPESEQFF